MRTFKGPFGIAVTVALVGTALFHFWLGSVGVLDLRLARALHLTLLLPMVFILFPATKTQSPKEWPSVLDFILAATAFIVTSYVALHYEELNNRLELVSDIQDIEVIFGVFATVLVWEAARRVIGIGMAIVVAASVAYLLVGHFLPSPLGHRGFFLSRAIERMYVLENQGIFGSLTGISVSYLFLFVMFGTFVERCGVGEWFAEISQALVGHKVGGPAKIAVINSAMFGSISGSPTANVYGTGVYTIPLMKNMGYKPAFAGAVEAAASTGGQIMPPVMGASIFIMMALLGMTYIELITAALPAAILFFLAVAMVVHLEARRLGIDPVEKSKLPSRSKALMRSYYLLPILSMLLVLSLGYTPVKAALAGTFAAFIVSFARKDTRMTPRRLCDVLATGTRSAILIAIACAAAGLVVSALTATGLSLAFSSMIVSSANGLLFLSLAMVALTSILLGMGMPTTPAYILSVTVAAPALIDLGVIPLAAHMFVFYFAIISGVTPPVAITSYAAAGVANASPTATSIEAFKLSIAGFIIPFALVYHPSLLLQGDAYDFILSFTFALIGISAVAASMAGYWMASISPLIRTAMFIAGVLIILPNWLLWLVGFGLLIPCLVNQVFLSKKFMTA